MKKFLIFLCVLSSMSNLKAQEYFPTNSEIKSTSHHYTAFTNAKIYVTPTLIINNGTLLIKDGRVVSAAAAVKLPKNTTIINLNGKFIYPSFIDL